EEHLRKQHRLRNAGIKVLSLFFIDRVDNYQPEDGVIRRLFTSTFDELKSKYGGWQELTAEEVQAAYFAERRNRAGERFLEDSKSGETERDREAYDLIMKDKERLLSFDEPTCFIFSHSALREGWDNPNVFQICTLNQTASDIKKRQEIGRGVRLAVNQAGDRVREPELNVLTVVANESYEQYVGRLQAEIVEEYGLEGAPPKPANARRRKTARRQKQYFLSNDFKELWNRIKHKTRYAVVIDSARLVSDVLLELDEVEIRPPRVIITKAQVAVGEEDVFAPLQVSGAKTVLDLAGRYPLPPLVDMVADLLERSNPPVKVTRRTILEGIRRARNRQAAVDNPHEFATITAAVLKKKLDAHLVDGIKYEKLNEWYEMTQFDAEIDTWEDYLTPAPHSLYDHVEFESDVERRFVEDLEKLDYVKLYVKLPNWFTVQTPVGEYNPDWAIVMEDRDEHGDPVGEKLYLVRETKDTTDLEQLRPDEKRKIMCGKQHFEQALGVPFKVVTKASELP
ncbi:MAG: DEAD/DEAH box helicase, partial [Actinobacteria bacterium]|nr:DEAD/DEAH box helicase [Actinomycetota bacterium]